MRAVFDGVKERLDVGMFQCIHNGALAGPEITLTMGAQFSALALKKHCVKTVNLGAFDANIDYVTCES